jgi:hypothetical protein
MVAIPDERARNLRTVDTVIAGLIGITGRWSHIRTGIARIGRACDFITLASPLKA